jgi:hypothetical protein
MNTQFGEGVCAKVIEKRRPVRLSDQAIKLWCGKHSPTEELEGWLKDRGFEILPGLDLHGGWDARRAEESGETLALHNSAGQPV